MTNGLKRASLTKKEWTIPGEGNTNQVARVFLLSPLLSLPHELYELVYQQALLAKGWQQLCVPRRGTPVVYVLANDQDAGMNKNDEKQFTNANKNFWHVYNVTEAQSILHIPAVIKKTGAEKKSRSLRQRIPDTAIYRNKRGPTFIHVDISSSLRVVNVSLRYIFRPADRWAKSFTVV